MPDTLVTLSALEQLLLNIQKQAYQQGQAEMQAKVDSLQQLLDAAPATTWADVAVGATTGLIIGLVLLTFALYMDRR